MGEQNEVAWYVWLVIGVVRIYDAVSRLWKRERPEQPKSKPKRKKPESSKPKPNTRKPKSTKATKRKPKKPRA